MNVVFSLRKDQISENGVAVIYFYVSDKGKRSKKRSTGVSVYEKYWKKKFAIGRNSKPINDALDDIRADIKTIYNEYKDRIKNIQEIVDKYKGIEKVATTFLDLYDLLVEKKTKEKKAKSTIETYITFRDCWIKKYLQSIKSENLLATDFTHVHLEGIYDMMLSSKKIKSNDYIKHQLSKARAAITLGYSRGFIQNDAVAQYDIHIEADEKEYVYLDIEEVERLEQLTFSEKERILERDCKLFLFQCYTGLSFNELIHFDKKQIVEKDGWTWIQVNRGKTNGLQLVPLFDKALKILEDFEYSFPKLYQHKYNPNIRSCAYRARIDKYLHSHIARNTCGAFLLNMGVTLQVVSRVLGHKSIKTTERYYAKIIDTWRVKDEFNRVFRKNLVKQ